MSDLKPCPFCGGKAVPTRRNYSRAVVCKNCAACAFGDTEIAAVASWNRRALNAEAKLAGGEVTACRSCKGTGYSLGEVTAGRICSVCNGSGSLTHPVPTHNDGSGEITEAMVDAFKGAYRAHLDNVPDDAVQIDFRALEREAVRAALEAALRGDAS